MPRYVDCGDAHCIWGKVPFRCSADWAAIHRHYHRMCSGRASQWTDVGLVSEARSPDQRALLSRRSPVVVLYCILHHHHRLVNLGVPAAACHNVERHPLRRCCHRQFWQSNANHDLDNVCSGEQEGTSCPGRGFRQHLSANLRICKFS